MVKLATKLHFKNKKYTKQAETAQHTYKKVDPEPKINTKCRQPIGEKEQKIKTN